jgi:hypothetical protein
MASKGAIMEPGGPSEPHELRGLRIDILRRAVDIYLALAYPTSPPPDAVRRRLVWPEGADAPTLLSQPPFERANKSSQRGTSIYALRLGNMHYPHMKVQVQPWPNAAGFLLSVNTHDQVMGLEPSADDLPAFRALQKENQDLKESIEQAWDAAGLPTFLRYLREYINGQGGKPSTDPDPGPAAG